jgi:hypothetical protein
MTELGVRPPVRIAHHHPAVKWGLMIAILAVVGLSLPHGASAAAPSVQPPTGPQSGGVFTGPFSFQTYTDCSNGVSYNGSYNSNLDGTNNFAFYGAADGSLLLRINGGGFQLLSSCGDPYNSTAQVANYTVSKNTASPPTPSPTPTPSATPIPTPVPPSGGGTSGSGSGGGSAPGGPSSSHNSSPASPSGSASQSSSTPAVAAVPVPGAAVATLTPLPISVKAPAALPRSGVPAKNQASHTKSRLNGLGLILILMVFIGSIALGARFRGHLRTELTHLRTSFAWRVEPIWFRVRTALRRRHGSLDPRRRGLSHHRYSGRLMAHHHTSYPALAFLLIIGALSVVGVGFGSHAASSTVSLTVSGPPPTVGATITQPIDGVTTSNSVMTVRGDCGPGLRVEITRDTSFAGSTLCDSLGVYALTISLVGGQNNLTALNYDGADQPGPTTPGVAVTYNPPVIILPSPSPSPGTTPSARPVPTATPTRTQNPTMLQQPGTSQPGPIQALVIDSNKHYYQGLATGSAFSTPLTIIGGVAPYHLTVDWGDQTSSQSYASAAGPIEPSHTFASPGNYTIVFNLVDKSGQRSVLTILAIVNGTPPVAAPISSKPDGVSAIMWPVLVGSALIVFSFWLGERDHFVRRAPAPTPAFG